MSGLWLLSQDCEVAVTHAVSMPSCDNIQRQADGVDFSGFLLTHLLMEFNLLLTSLKTPSSISLTAMKLHTHGRRVGIIVTALDTL